MIAWTTETACKKLGVAPGVPSKDLKKAFRQRARETHPDLVGPSGHDLFLEIRSAYDYLVAIESGQVSPQEEPSAPVSAKPIEIGDWLIVQYLMVNGLVHHGRHRVQVSVVDFELCMALYLDPPFEGPVGSILVAVSQEEHTEVALYEKPVISTSATGKQTTVVWFSPFERRMRVDGRPLDEPSDEDVVWRRFFDARRRRG